MRTSTLRRTRIGRIEHEAAAIEQPRRLFDRESVRWRDGDLLTMVHSQIALACVLRTAAGWHVRLIGDSKISGPMPEREAAWMLPWL